MRVLAINCGSSSLKSVLSSLDSRQQALVLGHAVPMPVVIRTRAYDEASGIEHPRVWTAERDREMWAALEQG